MGSGGKGGGGCPGLSASEQVSMIKTLLPEYVKAELDLAGKMEDLRYGKSAEFSPKYAALMEELYSAYAPKLNAIGRDIISDNRLADSLTDLEVLQGPGKDLIATALETSKTLDPEFFQTRATVNEGLQKLIGSIDLGGQLSAGEQSQIERATNQQMERLGVGTSPAPINVVGSAMTYGNAQRQRELENQQAFGQALGLATQSMPSMRYGLDPVQTALGRPSINPGEGKFTGISQPDFSDATQLTGNFMNYMSNLNQSQTQADIAKMNQGNWWQNFIPGMGDISYSRAGGAGLGCCFIFLESYNGKLPWFVRYCRDKFYTMQKRNGYVITSNYLVPLMRKYKLARWLVNSFMVKPLSTYGGYYCGIPGFKHGWVYKPVKEFWFALWNIIGKFGGVKFFKG